MSLRFSIAGETKLPGQPESAETAIRVACANLAVEVANELLGHWGEDSEGPYLARAGKVTGDAVAGQDMRLSVVVSFSKRGG